MTIWGQNEPKIFQNCISLLQAPSLIPHPRAIDCLRRQFITTYFLSDVIFYVYRLFHVPVGISFSISLWQGLQIFPILVLSLCKCTPYDSVLVCTPIQPCNYHFLLIINNVMSMICYFSAVNDICGITGVLESDHTPPRQSPYYSGQSRESTTSVMWTRNSRTKPHALSLHSVLGALAWTPTNRRQLTLRTALVANYLLNFWLMVCLSRLFC